MNQIIQIKNIEKSFEKRKVINGLSFDVFKNEILCLLGPNGAGKSTTINILLGMYKIDKGEIYFDGQLIKKNGKYKKKIGIVPQDIEIYENLTAIQNVRFFASLYNIKGEKLEKNCEVALKQVGLWDRKDDKPKTFSGGMKRRLNIACAIAHEPELIIMDEPTVGIDPHSRNCILESIKKLNKKGTTIIYSTHYMEEAEEIADRIVVVDNGKCLIEGGVEEIKKHVEEEEVIQIGIIGNVPDDLFNIKSIDGIKDVEKWEDENGLKVVAEVESEILGEVISLIENNKCKIKSILCEEMSLEKAFLKLTGESLRD